VADRSQQSKFGKSETPTGTDQRVIRAGFCPLRIDERAPFLSPRDTDAIRGALDVFDHDNCIRAFWNGRSGHDFDGFPMAYDARKDAPGTHLADNVKFARKFRGAHREPITDGAGERGNVTVGPDIFGEHAAAGVRKWDGFGVETCRGRANSLDDAGSRLLECEYPHAVILATVERWGRTL
jgi:hypothetical protein